MRTTQEILINNIKTLRKNRSWSQLRLSVESYVSPGMIGEIETGKKYPSLETLDKIASAFGIQTYKLIYDFENAEEENRTREENKQKIIKMISEM